MAAPLVPVLRLNGLIGMATPLRPGLTLANCAGALDRAFSYRRARAVALLINSPGGSPVQSHLIFNRIRALAEEKKLPVFVFCEDVAASGGYMLALAGDEIYADPSSIVGSVGVIAAGFGFDKAIDRLGIDRRVYTAGAKKMMLDPFQPEKRDDIKRLEALQSDVHESFKAMVRDRRRGRLKGEEESLFSGEFWSGARAHELGLIDGLGDLRTVMRKKYGDKVQLKLVGPGRSWLRRRLAVTDAPDGSAPADLFAPRWADDLLSAIEARAHWSRFGL